MKDAVAGTNLLAGGIAAALLVVLVFALGVPLWLAVVLAVVAFAGIALLGIGGRPGRATDERAGLREILRHGANEVAEMRRLAPRVPADATRARVLAICDSADRILGSLEAGAADRLTAQTFLDRYLVPTRGLLTRYVRLAGRGVASAGPALTKIEEHDLPMLDDKLRDLYEGLHRGDVIDLEVASEMLEFDLTGAEPVSPRRLPG